jgi:serine/threonine protein phosphatase PrpC
MRNFVECCIGGEAWMPEMAIGGLRRLQPGDTLLLCSDGFWSSMDETQVAGILSRTPPEALRDTLKQLATAAVAANGPTSDNTSGAVLRWLGV